MNIICFEKRTVFREWIKLWATRNRLCPRLNVWAYFHPEWRLLCLLSFNFFRNAHSFENWGIFSDNIIPQFQLGNIQSCDMFRPITRKRKYLMGYNSWYHQHEYIKLSCIIMDMIVSSYHLFDYQILIVPSHFLPFLSLLCFLTEQNRTEQNKTVYFSSLYTFREMYKLIV